MKVPAFTLYTLHLTLKRGSAAKATFEMLKMTDKCVFLGSLTAKCCACKTLFKQICFFCKTFLCKIVVIWFDVLTSFYRTLSVWHGAKLCVRLFYAVWRKSVISIRQRTLRGKAAGGLRREAKGDEGTGHRFDPCSQNKNE